MNKLAPVAAALLSALLLHLGTGLHPVSWLTWVAFLPVLLVASRVGAGPAFASGSLAWLGGQTQMWSYYSGTIETPLVVTAPVIIGTSIAFGLVTLIFRTLLARGRPVLAALAVPAAWVALEYAMSLSAPHGAWWSLAYTQADVLPVLQTAALTGVWGITFLLLLVPAAIAALLAPGAPGRLRVAVTAGAIVAVALGHGAWRLMAPADGSGRQVALVSTDDPRGSADLSSPQGQGLSRRYTSAIEAAAAGGARVVILPEATFRTDSSLPLGRPSVDVVVGAILRKGDVKFNAALAYPVEYDKQHMIPGLESEFTPGKSLAFLPGSTWGLIICKDLDFPELVRDYRNRGATALLAPAWDFDDDAWLHSRMAITRGVESGLSVARVARAGLLVVSDPRGRVLAEARSAKEMTTVTATLPDHAQTTLYGRLGDWAAWASAGLLLLVLAGLGRGAHPLMPPSSSPATWTTCARPPTQ
ncbi:nitrilase-related carbon-nitrogen hydrolase [Nonomuraea sp. NPDC049480]|uniref:nitrilase-related carbon-nitrogen hydrolase n=1 Tax=Nonomuraea sp. NPDC049480 TaxID=3364353 RepID=UPI00379F7397